MKVKKALILVGGKFHPFEECGKILADYLEGTGIAKTKIEGNRKVLKDLKGYDLIIIYTQGGKLTKAEEKGLCNFVQEGGGCIGIHCASDSFVKNERYMELIGSHFIGHGPVTSFQVNVIEKGHSITRRLKDAFNITDEFYLLEKKTKEFKLLFSGLWQGKTEPLGYIRDYGKGKVFYLGLGHDQRAFNHPEFQKIIFRAVRYVTGEKDREAIKCAIIGYGPAFGMGRIHAQTIKRIPGLELAAICDLNPQAIEQAKKDFPEIKGYISSKEVVRDKEIKLVIIVTPHHTHAPLALEMLEAGKNVICEKPFCLREKEATKMIEKAKEKNCMLSCYHNRRWDGDFLAIKKIIDEGKIGDVFHLEAFAGNYRHPDYWWRSHKPVSGGAFYDWGAHFVDWILNLMPEKIESVSGYFQKRVWHDVSNEDQCEAMIRFSGNRTANLQISSIAAIGKPRWRILGTKGGLIINSWEEKKIKATYIEEGKKIEVEIPFEESDWDAYYCNIADHLLLDYPLAVTAESARRVIAVLEAAELSAKKRGKLT